ncbi:MAG: ACT domain-containing protein, partial [Candidatus Diapherotrites archaeon]|nr:ACT domain-containing protein [Candidatus Diapherotrites archaeon]
TITLILGEEWVERVKRMFEQFVVKTSSGLVEIVMKSSREIESTPGVLDYVYGQLAEHGVNLLETASSWTDTIFVIEEKDLSRAMEAMRF